MTIDFLYNYLKQHKFVVLATVTPENKPESAYVGFVVTPDLRLFFDATSDSRKIENLKQNPNISFVIGWDDDRTVQYEGMVSFPKDEELEKMLEIYFSIFPEGKERQLWPNIIYCSVEPIWIRYSNFNAPQRIEELVFETNQ